MRDLLKQKYTTHYTQRTNTELKYVLQKNNSINQIYRNNQKSENTYTIHTKKIANKN